MTIRPKTSFCTITLITLASYGILRFVGWKYYANTSSWSAMNTDFWHHWELALVLIGIGIHLLKKFPTIQNIVLAIASGQILDEFTYAIFPQETLSDFQWQLQHWHEPLVFELMLFTILCFMIHQQLKRMIWITGIIAIAFLVYTDLRNL